MVEGVTAPAVLGLLAAGLALVLGAGRRLRARRRARAAPAGGVTVGAFGYGSVYVFATRDGALAKVGRTGRLCRVRKAEVAGGTGLDLVQVYALDRLPFAPGVERTAHALLAARGLWIDTALGTEWFRTGPGGDVSEIVGTVERAALLVRDAARGQGRWPDWADGTVSFWRRRPGGGARGLLVGGR